jgi:putative nucleotidyltransferase with HDIG domain
MSTRLDQVFELYEKHGEAGYIGEHVSQIEHALQCARLAEIEGFHNHVILGSLFHDLGHLLGEIPENKEKLKQMIHDGVNYGVARHEKLGADFLRELGVPEKICYFIENHVAAKRYLVFKVNLTSFFF